MNANERETCLNMTGDDHNTWELFTDDPFMIRHMARLNIAPVETVGAGYRYKLNADQVLIRRGKKQLSSTTRQAMAARLQNARTTEAFKA